MYDSMNYSLEKQTDSKEPLRTWTPAAIGSTLKANFSFSEVLNLIDMDPIARGALNAYVDKFMEGGWNIIKNGKVDTNFLAKLESMDFDNKVLRKVALHGKLFNNAFLEIVKDSRGTKSLNVLDPLNIDVKTFSNGDPELYRSSLANPNTGEYSYWSPEEVTWFKFGDRDGGFAPVDIKALYSNLLTKIYVMRFVTWLYQTGQYRVVYNFKNASGKVIDDFIAYNKKNDNNFKSPFLSGGEMDAKVLRDMKEIDSLTAFLEKLDSDTLVLLRISPSEAGLPDGSGRSNADAQLNTLNTHITSQKKVVAGGLNNDTFVKMGKGNDKIVFKPSDRFVFTQIIDNALKLKGVGFTDKAMKEYFGMNGVYFETNKLFERFEDPKSGNKYNDVLTQETAPSRQGKTEGVSNDKIGTGEQGSTRSDQLVKQADKRYWVYDALVEDDE